MSLTNPNTALADTIAKELRTLKITIAVDISSSTTGRTNKTEIAAIRDILSIMDLKDFDTVSVLPWSSLTHSIISLPSEEMTLDFLAPNYGTSPSCLYTNAAYLDVLKGSDTWFLFTDGQITQQEIETFSQRTTQFGLHGYANVIVIFGPAHGQPAHVNFSVGLTTYALAADSLFLFHDTSNSIVYLLQAKGCFKCLLPSEAAQPILDDNLTWDMLPQIKYHDLANIKIPSPKVLSNEQVAFQDGLVIRLKDLYDGKLSEEVEKKVINSENLQSLAMEALASGKSPNFQRWVHSKQQVISASPRPMDVEGAAYRCIKDVFDLIERGVDKATLDASRKLLQFAHQRNWVNFRDSLRNHETIYAPVRETNKSLRKVRNSSVRMSTPSRNNKNYSAGVTMGYEDDFLPVHNTGTATSTVDPSADKCFLPGFKRAASSLTALSSEFSGKCELCHGNSILVFLLKKPNIPIDLTREGSHIIYPDMNIGGVSIFDIFFSPLYCDSCAFHLSVPGANLLSQPIVGAIALVTCSMNRQAWIAELKKVFNEPAVEASILSQMASILDTAVNVEAITALEDGSVYKNALLWFKEDLKNTVQTEEDRNQLLQAM